MTRNPLTSSFQRRMLPLAILCGILVGAGLPAVYPHGLRTELTREANVAGGITSRLSPRVVLRPRLWSYDVDGLDAAIQLASAYPGISVVIETAQEPQAYLLGRAMRPTGASGSALLKVEGRNVARACPT